MIENRIVSVLASADIHPQPTPPSDNTTLPCIVYTVSTATPWDRDLSGAYTQVKCTVDIECWTLHQDDNKSLMRTIREAIDTPMSDFTLAHMMSESRVRTDRGCYGTASYTIICPPDVAYQVAMKGQVGGMK